MWFFVAAIHLVQNLPNFLWTVTHGQEHDAAEPSELVGFQRSAPYYARSEMLQKDYWADLRGGLNSDCWHFTRTTLLREPSRVKATPSKSEERPQSYPPPRWLKNSVRTMELSEIPDELRRAR
jgi:hypothetical protein